MSDAQCAAPAAQISRHRPGHARFLANSGGFTGVMTKALDFTTRSGNLTLSVVALAGLSLLAVQLWSIAAGYVLLLLLPALATSLYQLITSRDYGLHMDAQRWRVTSQSEDREIATSSIAFLRITEHGPISRAVIVLIDGREIAIPFDLAHDPLDLIRAATDLGVPVRTA
jgi:hypothetical protein